MKVYHKTLLRGVWNFIHILYIREAQHVHLGIITGVHKEEIL
jgi:hypothetical protein